MHCIIIHLSRNKGLFEESREEDNVAVTGFAVTSCLKRRL